MLRNELLRFFQDMMHKLDNDEEDLDTVVQHMRLYASMCMFPRIDANVFCKRPCDITIHSHTQTHRHTHKRAYSPSLTHRRSLTPRRHTTKHAHTHAQRQRERKFVTLHLHSIYTAFHSYLFVRRYFHFQEFLDDWNFWYIRRQSSQTTSPSRLQTGRRVRDYK